MCADVAAVEAKSCEVAEQGAGPVEVVDEVSAAHVVGGSTSG
jgi:hypothetical protein